MNKLSKKTCTALLATSCSIANAALVKVDFGSNTPVGGLSVTGEIIYDEADITTNAFGESSVSVWQSFDISVDVGSWILSGSQIHTDTTSIFSSTDPNTTSASFFFDTDNSILDFVAYNNSNAVTNGITYDSGSGLEDGTNLLSDAGSIFGYNFGTLDFIINSSGGGPLFTQFLEPLSYSTSSISTVPVPAGFILFASSLACLGQIQSTRRKKLMAISRCF